MQLFAKIANGWKPLTIFPKNFILDIWQVSEFASACKTGFQTTLANISGISSAERKMTVIWHITSFHLLVFTTVNKQNLCSDSTVKPKPSRHFLVQSQQSKHQSNVWNLFKVNNEDTRTTSDANLVSLSLTLNRFHTLFWCFHYWLWTVKC